MPAKGSKKKEKGSKKGSKKGKGKKVPEDTKVVRDMHVCCTQGNAVELQKFLEIPLGPERKWDFSQPGTAECLPLACENGAVTCARLLLDAGCEVDVVSGKALHKAVTNGHEDIVHLLTERGANLNIRSIFEEKTALMYAAHEGRMALATFLLRNGARVDEKSHEENCGVHNGWSALHFAADEGHMKMVEFLVETGKATVDLPAANGETALALAAEHGQFEEVKYLVSAGADLHAMRRGLNVVQWCIYRANADTVQFLVSYGAKPDLTVKCIWFADRDDTLYNIIRREFSRAIYDKVDTAIYRGTVKLRERAAHMRLLSEAEWEDEAVQDPDSMEGPRAGETKQFPKHIIHMISSYEL